MRPDALEYKQHSSKLTLEGSDCCCRVRQDRAAMGRRTRERSSSDREPAASVYQGKPELSGHLHAGCLQFRPEQERSGLRRKGLRVRRLLSKRRN